MVTDIISPMLLWILLSIENKPELSTIIINSLGYLVVLIGSLIYNEIIILKCFGLHKHTKSIMEKEANMDYIKNIKPNQSIDENITFSENDEQESISIVI